MSTRSMPVADFHQAAQDYANYAASFIPEGGYGKLPVESESWKADSQARSDMSPRVFGASHSEAQAQMHRMCQAARGLRPGPSESELPKGTRIGRRPGPRERPAFSFVQKAERSLRGAYDDSAERRQAVANVALSYWVIISDFPDTAQAKTAAKRLEAMGCREDKDGILVVDLARQRRPRCPGSSLLGPRPRPNGRWSSFPSGPIEHALHLGCRPGRTAAGQLRRRRDGWTGGSPSSGSPARFSRRPFQVLFPRLGV